MVHFVTAIYTNAGAGTEEAGEDNNISTATACGYGDSFSEPPAIARAPDASAMGSYSLANAASATALGSNTRATGASATAVGGRARAVSANDSAFGPSAFANGGAATATGASANATGTRAAAFGNNSRANGAAALALGASANATGANATAAGGAANGANTLAMGGDATRAGAIAIGQGSSVNNVGAIAIGARDAANGDFATIIGIDSSAEANGVSLGSGSPAGTNAVAVLGPALGANSTSIGGKANYDNSAYFGPIGGATAIGQQVFGSALLPVNFRLAGLVSGAKPQSGPLYRVTTDSAGQLFYTALPAGGLTCANAAGADAGALACGKGAVATGVNAASWGAAANATGERATATGAGAQSRAAAASALGTRTQAGAAGALALGRDANAAGLQSLAAGAGSQAGVTDAGAFGARSAAPGAGAFAAGVGARAGADQALALGAGAEASGAGSVAVGSGAMSLSYAETTALGAGAQATANGQLMLGTAASTTVLPGVGSGESSAAQQGPVSYLTVDAQGQLASSSVGPGGFGQVETLSRQATTLEAHVAGVGQSLGALQGSVRRGYEGAAAAMAASAPAPALEPGRRYAVTGKWANFRGETALGATAQVRVDDNTVFVASMGGGPTRGGVALGAGGLIEW